MVGVLPKNLVSMLEYGKSEGCIEELQVRPLMPDSKQHMSRTLPLLLTLRELTYRQSGTQLGNSTCLQCTRTRRTSCRWAQLLLFDALSQLACPGMGCLVWCMQYR